MVGKYIERFMTFEKLDQPKSLIDINFLKENGFV
jgi:hypothetical protein